MIALVFLALFSVAAAYPYQIGYEFEGKLGHDLPYHKDFYARGYPYGQYFQGKGYPTGEFFYSKQGYGYGYGYGYPQSQGQYYGYPGYYSHWSTPFYGRDQIFGRYGYTQKHIGAGYGYKQGAFAGEKPFFFGEYGLPGHNYPYYGIKDFDYTPYHYGQYGYGSGLGYNPFYRYYGYPGYKSYGYPKSYLEDFYYKY